MLSLFHSVLAHFIDAVEHGRILLHLGMGNSEDEAETGYAQLHYHWSYRLNRLFGDKLLSVALSHVNNGIMIKVDKR